MHFKQELLLVTENAKHRNQKHLMLYDSFDHFTEMFVLVAAERQFED